MTPIHSQNQLVLSDGEKLQGEDPSPGSSEDQI